MSGFAQNILADGIWRGVLHLSDTTEVPFNFEVNNSAAGLSIEIMNADERIKITEIQRKADTLIIQLPVFNSEFHVKSSATSLTGFWIDRSKNEEVRFPFTAVANQPKRFLFPDKVHPLLKERFKVTFKSGTPNAYSSIGLFQTVNNRMTGTFTSETGDYRYLEGFSDDKGIMLSCFDGAHAYLFTADRAHGNLINGRFYSGKIGYETWKASMDNTFELTDPYTLTYLKPGYDAIDFSFKNLEGKTISLSDEKFKNKVIIVQLMGSWCPNCMDETKFLSGFYEQYKTKGVEIIGLAFERSTDFNQAATAVTRLKKRFNANYEFLITQQTGADQASKALPMLNKVMAFPTTIYIDKKGRVRKIHTGFNGPATGEKYTNFVNDTKSLIDSFLKE